jgi:hypothetical protein
MEAMMPTRSLRLGFYILIGAFSTSTWADQQSNYASLLNSAKSFQQKGYKHQALPLLFEAQLLS